MKRNAKRCQICAAEANDQASAWLANPSRWPALISAADCCDTGDQMVALFFKLHLVFPQLRDALLLTLATAPTAVGLNAVVFEEAVSAGPEIRIPSSALLQLASALNTGRIWTITLDGNH